MDVFIPIDIQDSQQNWASRVKQLAAGINQLDELPFAINTQNSDMVADLSGFRVLGLGDGADTLIYGLATDQTFRDKISKATAVLPCLWKDLNDVTKDAYDEYKTKRSTLLGGRSVTSASQVAGDKTAICDATDENSQVDLQLKEACSMLKNTLAGDGINWDGVDAYYTIKFADD